MTAHTLAQTLVSLVVMTGVYLGVNRNNITMQNIAFGKLGAPTVDTHNIVQNILDVDFQTLSNCNNLSILDKILHYFGRQSAGSVREYNPTIGKTYCLIRIDTVTIRQTSFDDDDDEPQTRVSVDSTGKEMIIDTDEFAGKMTTVWQAKTAMQFYFPASEFDDVTSSEKNNTGLLMYSMRDNNCLFILVLSADGANTYTYHFQSPTDYIQNYENQILNVLQLHCYKYVHCRERSA